MADTNRRSFLAGILSSIAGTWVAGSLLFSRRAHAEECAGAECAEELAKKYGGKPTVKYGGPTVKYGGPPATKYGGPTVKYGGPPKPPPGPAKKYGGPPATKYGGPVMKYGGPPVVKYGGPKK
jgi:hypothetical protein